MYFHICVKNKNKIKPSHTPAAIDMQNVELGRCPFES